jgi:hypothetical protein
MICNGRHTPKSIIVNSEAIFLSSLELEFEAKSYNQNIKMDYMVSTDISSAISNAHSTTITLIKALDMLGALI